MSSNANYTMTWNALDYPAIAFPVTYVDKSKDLKVVRTQFLGVEDKANYDICKLITDTRLLLKLWHHRRSYHDSRSSGGPSAGRKDSGGRSSTQDDGNR